MSVTKCDCAEADKSDEVSQGARKRNAKKKKSRSGTGADSKTSATSAAEINKASWGLW